MPPHVGKPLFLLSLMLLKVLLWLGGGRLLVVSVVLSVLLGVLLGLGG